MSFVPYWPQLVFDALSQFFLSSSPGILIRVNRVFGETRKILPLKTVGRFVAENYRLGRVMMPQKRSTSRGVEEKNMGNFFFSTLSLYFPALDVYFRKFGRVFVCFCDADAAPWFVPSADDVFLACAEAFGFVDEEAPLVCVMKEGGRKIPTGSSAGIGSSAVRGNFPERLRDAAGS